MCVACDIQNAFPPITERVHAHSFTSGDITDSAAITSIMTKLVPVAELAWHIWATVKKEIKRIKKMRVDKVSNQCP